MRRRSVALEHGALHRLAALARVGERQQALLGALSQRFGLAGEVLLVDERLGVGLVLVILV